MYTEDNTMFEGLEDKSQPQKEPERQAETAITNSEYMYQTSEDKLVTYTVLTRQYASPFLLIRFSYKYGGGLIIE